MEKNKHEAETTEMYGNPFHLTSESVCPHTHLLGRKMGEESPKGETELPAHSGNALPLAVGVTQSSDYPQACLKATIDYLGPGQVVTVVLSK
jgi:hypothetical protein